MPTTVHVRIIINFRRQRLSRNCQWLSLDKRPMQKDLLHVIHEAHTV